MLESINNRPHNVAKKHSRNWMPIDNDNHKVVGN
jgi:hypothetical protein